MGRKQMYGYFKRQIAKIAHEIKWTLLRRENHKRETESLLIVVHNTVIRTNYIKEKIDNTLQNSVWPHK